MTGNQILDKEEKVQVMVSCHGIYGVHTMHVFPPVIVFPGFAENPVLSISNQELTLAYRLNLPEEEDETDIIWVRQKDGRILAVSNGSPCTRYRLTRADIGSAIEARLCPKGKYTEAGNTLILSSRMIQPSDVQDASIRIMDFRSFPTVVQPKRQGDFYITTYRPLYQGVEVAHVADWEPGDASRAWTYGRGRDGAKNCYGLVTTKRGASLQYIAGEYKGPMKVKAVFCPDKDTGEGFGSANGQFTELFLKYNAGTQNGYALRIERIPDFANGCVFSLRRYVNGIGTCIAAPVMSSAYMPPCTVIAEATDHMLTVHAYTGWPRQPQRARKRGILSEVSMKAPYEENGFGDVEIHHTGTVPLGNRTILSELVIEYGRECKGNSISF